MRLVERHIFKKSSREFATLDELCYMSKNLYNYSLYCVRQHFFKTGKYLNKFELINTLTKEKQFDYVNLPAVVAQQVIYLVDQNFKSFFALLKKKQKGQYEGIVKIPKYLHKEKGRQVATFNINGISSKFLKQNLIKLAKIENIFIETSVANKVKQVRIVPKSSFIVVEVVYEIKDKQFKSDNKRYASIDLGINNLATIGSNVMKPFIINGRPLKSINQYYNKKKSKLQSEKDKSNRNSFNSRKLRNLSIKRYNKIQDYFHKASRYIVNQLVSNNINTLIIGHNKEWKQETNLGKKNNQKFVEIPHSKLISMIKYKCALEGIKVIEREESYTSKASFIDNDKIPSYTKSKKKFKEKIEFKEPIFSGIRIKRGLYKSKIEILINADLNGALNILRKEVPNAFNGYGIEVCSTPKIIHLS
jgi:putative transposase